MIFVVDDQATLLLGDAPKGSPVQVTVIARDADSKSPVSLCSNRWRRSARSVATASSAAARRV